MEWLPVHRNLNCTVQSQGTAPAFGTFSWNLLRSSVNSMRYWYYVMRRISYTPSLHGNSTFPKISGWKTILKWLNHACKNGLQKDLFQFFQFPHLNGDSHVLGFIVLHKTLELNLYHFSTTNSIKGAPVITGQRPQQKLSAWAQCEIIARTTWQYHKELTDNLKSHTIATMSWRMSYNKWYAKHIAGSVRHACHWRPQWQQYFSLDRMQRLFVSLQARDIGQTTTPNWSISAAHLTQIVEVSGCAQPIWAKYIPLHLSSGFNATEQVITKAIFKTQTRKTTTSLVKAATQWKWWKNEKRTGLKKNSRVTSNKGQWRTSICTCKRN